MGQAGRGRGVGSSERRRKPCLIPPTTTHVPKAKAHVNVDRQGGGEQGPELDLTKLLLLKRGAGGGRGGRGARLLALSIALTITLVFSSCCCCWWWGRQGSCLYCGLGLGLGCRVLGLPMRAMPHSPLPRLALLPLPASLLSTHPGTGRRSGHSGGGGGGGVCAPRRHGRKAKDVPHRRQVLLLLLLLVLTLELQVLPLLHGTPSLPEPSQGVFPAPLCLVVIIIIIVFIRVALLPVSVAVQVAAAIAGPMLVASRGRGRGRGSLLLSLR